MPRPHGTGIYHIPLSDNIRNELMKYDEIKKAIANPNAIVPTINDRTRNNDSRQGSGREIWRNPNSRPNEPGFKGKIEGLSILGKKSEKRTESFIVFQQDIHDHVISNFDYASDIAPLIKEFIDPMMLLMRHIPTKNKLLVQAGIDPTADESKLTPDEKEIVDGINEIFPSKLKLFSKRRYTLFQDITKLYGVVCGQCTLSLQEDNQRLKDWKLESDQYNTLWLL